MFTGIVENIGNIKRIEKEQENLHITVESAFASELQIDQSVLHNGICLTVVALADGEYTVTAIKETIDVTSIGQWQVGQELNLERAMLMNGRLDGHIVQGHVDHIATCVSIEEVGGSTYFGFEYKKTSQHVTIEKGSITIDGTSLTVVDSGINTFKVAIIPYTLEHTIFKHYQVGTVVNLEFDVVGKYVAKLVQLRSL
ncbi:riboflavin synthase [Myroides odoratimimus]|uniref:Riboflavin synthase n=1 Tax=Myroides odoratimimus CIP 101113 TaxID=883154 RepID=A0AAV3F7Q4_9FLAO|nr:MULTISPECIES: riboflavin synthase [Myroides]APA91877.1 riboflavin synthase subunit alpha [Myroides sp. ZB35]EHO15163.1 riboflavin synthase, alpha subunit [Myroides odoratimimus CIP 101113]EKB04592.1 riboflavin synthase, alpha subunit [Myroides odoratimimus CCUG 3837]EPH10598.1 riboflavin synthase, alpha subunit [Myroides odoratimimus CCUG 12700]MCA4804899.1 riboflavin synthase [Myroides odoratimimus]